MINKSKQETLEEASWRFNPLKKLDGEFLRAAFIKGAKWQAERMYSEEEVEKLLVKMVFDVRGIENNWNGVQIWFQKNKKK
jgi:hypothetical protein